MGEEEKSGLIPAELKGKITAEVQSLDPNIKKLERLDKLGRRPDETLTELSNNETIYFSIIEALNDAEIIKTPAMNAFIAHLRINRVALNRKGIDEYLKGLIGQPQNYYPMLGAPGSFPQEEKRSWWDRISGLWRHDQ